jgi:hypothetical protein
MFAANDWKTFQSCFGHNMKKLYSVMQDFIPSRRGFSENYLSVVGDIGLAKVLYPNIY